MSYDNAYGRMIANAVQRINERNVRNIGDDDIMTGRGTLRGEPLQMASNQLERVIGGARLNRARYSWDEDIVSNPTHRRMVEKADTSSVSHSSLKEGSGLFSSVLGSFGLGDMNGGAMAFGEMKEGGAMAFGKKTRGRPKKQTQKDREDEKLAMEIKNIQRKEKGGDMSGKMSVREGGAMAFGEMKEGGAMAFGKKTKKGKGILSDLVGSFGLGAMENKGPQSQALRDNVGFSKTSYPSGMSGKGMRRLIPVQAMKGDSMSGGMKNDGRKKRAEIVKSVMNKHGLSMIEASKYVKENGLY